MKNAEKQPIESSWPEASRPGLTAGPEPERAAACLILLHGRGASAADIMPLRDDLGVEDFAVIAPDARGHSWYPQSFLAPLEANQPSLDAALGRLESLVSDLIARGVPSTRIALLGFSQGACLALEFVARHPRRYGAVIGLTGGLIGPPGTSRDYPGSLEQTPVFLGSGDPDPHVPFERVEETQQVLTKMGARVELKRYPDMPHTISNDELIVCRIMLRDIVTPAEDKT